MILRRRKHRLHKETQNATASLSRWLQGRAATSPTALKRQRVESSSRDGLWAHRANRGHGRRGAHGPGRARGPRSLLHSAPSASGRHPRLQPPAAGKFRGCRRCRPRNFFAGLAPCRDLAAGALSALPERQRTALALCHNQDMTNREAAQVLGIGVEALESLLARARRALRTALQDYRQPFRPHRLGDGLGPVPRPVRGPPNPKPRRVGGHSGADDAGRAPPLRQAQIRWQAPENETSAARPAALTTGSVIAWAGERLGRRSGILAALLT